MPTLRPLTLATIAVLGLAAHASAAGLLVGDDFNDNSIDGSKWNVVTAGAPAGAAVVEQNQRIELTGRGHLNTASQYDPAALGGLQVTGRWTFANGTDFMQILTRGSGTPSGGFGETSAGVEFYANATTLGIRGRGALAVTSVSSAFNFAANDVFDFVIIDDGLNVSLSMTEVGGDGTVGFVSSTATTDAPTDLVTFHNRENPGNSPSYLDDVSIVMLPEPSAFVPLLIAGALVLPRRRR